MESCDFHVNNKRERSSSPPAAMEEHREEKKKLRYKECMKNHAAAMGGHATDGCGEFMPSGEEGSPESLKCSACNCHRNFHRKEIIQSDNNSEYHDLPLVLPNSDTQITNPNKSNGSNPSSDQSDEMKANIDEVDKPAEKIKKRFRTKFSQEQKEKMLRFAEKASWRIQKLEESVVQQFCQEIGIKRKVLKVWMHNNKNSTFAKRNLSTMSG